MELPLFDFLLRGNTSLDPPKTPKNIKWLTEQNWKDIEQISSLNPKFQNLLTDIQQNEQMWRAYYDHPTPEEAEIPCEQNQIDILSKICILKIFRIDRLKEGISMYIVDKMGPE